MTKKLSAEVTKEDAWFVAQWVEVDVASQGETEQEALKNLKEALELHFQKTIRNSNSFNPYAANRD